MTTSPDDVEALATASEHAQLLKIYMSGRLPSAAEAKDALTKLERFIADGAVRITDGLEIDRIRARIAEDLK